jgi:Cu/Ag efflux protein CusF
VSVVRPVIVFALAFALVSGSARAGSEQYKAHGVVKSFGPKHAYVNIAHEKIPGYMEAMTMSFEPRRPEQLDGIDVGAKVSFTFTASEDGHRVLDAIAKD